MIALAPGTLRTFAIVQKWVALVGIACGAGSQISAGSTPLDGAELAVEGGAIDKIGVGTITYAACQ